MHDNINKEITQEELNEIKETLTPLVGLKIDWLSLPNKALLGFEPSQIAIIVNTLIDGILPQIELLATNEENRKKLITVGLRKAPGILGERESYPDYIHMSGKRIELKGLFVDNRNLTLKRTPTRREPSARLKENVTMEVINPKKDILLIVAVQLQEIDSFCYPHIVDLAVLSIIECIKARDQRLYDTGGKWIDGLPKVISSSGAKKIKNGLEISNSDYEKDTNFGKLKRIPYKPLEDFLKKWI